MEAVLEAAPDDPLQQSDVGNEAPIDTVTTPGLIDTVGTSVFTAHAPIIIPSNPVITGILAAHNDFVLWWYQPHASLLDGSLTKLDSRGVRREIVGYGLIGLIVVLLCTTLAPLIANVVCVAYPVLATLTLIRGQSEDGQRWLIYWIVFGLLSLTDYSYGWSGFYWLLKMVFCVFLYLPQTQGALFVYTNVINPVVNFTGIGTVSRLL